MPTSQFLLSSTNIFAFISGEAGRVYMLGWGKHFQKCTFDLEKYIFLSYILPQPNKETNEEDAGIENPIPWGSNKRHVLETMLLDYFSDPFVLPLIIKKKPTNM